MRQNLRVVLDAWREHRPVKYCASIHTDGNTIFSYDTAIVEREGDGRVLLNRTRYSTTTSQQQGALAAAIPFGLHVCGVPRGARELSPYAVERGLNQGAQDELNKSREGLTGIRELDEDEQGEIENHCSACGEYESECVCFDPEPAP